MNYLRVELRALRAGLLACVVFTLAFCSTPPGAVTVTEDERPATGDSINQMVDGVAVEPAEDGMPADLIRDLTPRDGVPRFVGISERMVNRADEQPAALLHAAEQAVRYVRIAAEYRLISERSGQRTYYVEDIVTDWDKEAAPAVLDRLTMVGAYQDIQRTYVLVEGEGLPEAPPVAIDIGTGRPSWVDSPPRTTGYFTAVGVSRQSTRLRSSIDHADEEALKQIITQIGTSVTTLEQSRIVEQGTTSSQTTSYERAQAEIRGFNVISRWISPDNRYIYSLAIARAAE